MLAQFRSRFLGKVSPVHLFWGGLDLAVTRLDGDGVFCSYAYPEPPGFRDTDPGLPDARYDEQLGEFVIPCTAVRTAAEPDARLLQFLQASYEAAADHAAWDRKALERPG